MARVEFSIAGVGPKAGDRITTNGRTFEYVTDGDKLKKVRVCSPAYAASKKAAYDRFQAEEDAREAEHEARLERMRMERECPVVIVPILSGVYEVQEAC